MAKFSSKPLVKRFTLKSDPDGEMWVEIRQATLGAEKRRNDILTNMRMKQGRDGDTEYIFDNNPLEVAMLDMYYTLSGMGGATLIDDDEQEVPYEPFKFTTVDGVTRLAHSEQQFLNILANSKLTGEYIMEIHKYILEVNPSFDPNRNR